MSNGTWNESEYVDHWTREYRRVMPRYEEYALTLQAILKQAGREYASLSIVQARPKSVSSFAEKILRKRHLYTNPLQDITDLCGARIIVHLQSEVSALSDFIKDNFEIDWANSIDTSQRLKPAEFGYRSTHFIVQFKPGPFPAKSINAKIPRKTRGLKAEIQVRTLLEHSWADFTHTMSYKGAFDIPDKWTRELAALAAALERCDSSFEQIYRGLNRYAATYGSFLTEPDNLELAARFGKLAITLGEWEKAIDILSKYVKSGYKPILRDLGVAMCKMNESNKQGGKYRQGQKYLEEATAPPSKDTDALASLAGTWKGVDDNKARELYRRAFEIDPADPYPLGNYLEYEITHLPDPSMISLLIPVLNAAIQRCGDQAEVGMNLPWAYYDVGKFNLLLGRPYEGLAAYCKAVQSSTAPFMIETSLKSIDRLKEIADSLPGLEWARRFLVLAWNAQFPSGKSKRWLKPLARDPIKGNVVILAGASSTGTHNLVYGYRELILEAFRDFKCSIISGGTASGIGALAGELAQAYPENIRAIGYVPKKLPANVYLDENYSEIRRTDGDDFSPIEVLQYWADILASGIEPSQVKLLGIHGGSIAAIEYRIAAALGATVAVFSQSGGEAQKLLEDDYWRFSQRIMEMPEDATTLSRYLKQGGYQMPNDMREVVGRRIHEAYRQERTKSVLSQDPAMAEWDALAENLRESNRQQADDIYEKLRRIGCIPRKVGKRKIALMSFSDEEVEIMAEMEHARWNIERLRDGWRLGEGKDVLNKISPYLRSWASLPGEAKEWDREAVRNIPELLASIGLEIDREYEERSHD
jgi:ppGpp synthetase/RelA/SpoT-type nucleotidyltranferase